MRYAIFSGAVLLGAVLTAGILHWAQGRRQAEAWTLTQENWQLRRRLMETQRAKAPAAAESRVETVVATSPADSRAAPAPSPEAPVGLPGEVHEYAGVGSAKAALQSFAWACEQGDVERVRQLLCFDPRARERADAYLAALPPDARQRWRSPEQLAALLFVERHMHSPFPPPRIVATGQVEEVSPVRVIVHLPGTYHEHTEFARQGETWRYVITEAEVNAYLQQVRAPAQPR